jgi:hypothetical protein
MGSADDERQELVVGAQAFEQPVARRQSGIPPARSEDFPQTALSISAVRN